MEALNSDTYRAGKASRPLVTFLVAFALMIIGPGTGSTWASGLSHANGQTHQAANTSGSREPDATCPPGGQCFADVTSGNPFYAFVNRMYQQNLVAGYPCGGPGEPCDSQRRPYYRPLDNVTRQQMAKFIDNARNLPQIHMQVSGGNTPIYSQNDTGTAIGAYSTSGQALVASSQTQVAIYAQTGDSIAVSGYAVGADSTGLSGNGNTGVTGRGHFGVTGTGDTGGYGVWGNNSDSIGVYGSSDTGNGVWGGSLGGRGVTGQSTSNIGVYGQSINNIGVYGDSQSGDAVHGQSTSGNGVIGHTSGLDEYGVYGASDNGTGVGGESYASMGVGVLGVDNTGTGVSGQGIEGVYGYSDSGNAVFGVTNTGYAGYFDGDVYVNGHITATGGCCSMSAGTTQIDDPLDPANKVLNQSLVQSPDMTTVINGNVMLDSAGEATVMLPPWFEAANGDFRYTLTPVGAPGPDLYIAKELSGNIFKIGGGKSNAKVSWQVTGVRRDPYALAHPIQPEQTKPAGEQGKYLYPAGYGQPASSGVDHVNRRQAAQP